MAEGEGRGGGDLGDDLATVFQIALIFIAVLLGRELGNIYGTYGEVSNLNVVLRVEEVDIAYFTKEVLEGNDAELVVGMTLTIPFSGNIQGPVTQMPDYVRRWLISVTLSPIIVQQPQVSRVEAQLWAEGELMLEETFSFERTYVPYRHLLNRTMPLHIEDPQKFRRIVEEASRRHAGEVEISLTGRVLTHVAFLESWLPFSTTSYPLVRVPHVNYLSSMWTDTGGSALNRARVGETVYVSLSMENPARVHSIWENVTATIYREGSERPIQTTQRTLGVAAGSKATYVFSFSPREPGTYYYTLDAPGGFTVTGSTPRLEVETG